MGPNWDKRQTAEAKKKHYDKKEQKLKNNPEQRAKKKEKDKARRKRRASGEAPGASCSSLPSCVQVLAKSGEQGVLSLDPQDSEEWIRIDVGIDSCAAASCINLYRCS